MELKMVDVSKCYQKKIQALNHVSLTLEHGVYGLLGPNGAGKSTLIQILTGNVRQTSGQIYYNGQNISKIEKLYKTVLGYVPQNQGIYDSFTATKFLEYMGVLKGLTKREIKTQLEEVLHTVGLFEVRERKLGGYSGGMKQRVLIAQALLGNPKLIILDEPTAGLDPKERVRFRNLISKLGVDRIVLLSTHIVSDVEHISNTILIMKRGKLIHKGSLSKIIKVIEHNVFECIVDSKTAETLCERYPIINIRQEENDVFLRLVAEETPVPNAVSVSATLEDLYLYYSSEVSENE